MPTEPKPQKPPGPPRALVDSSRLAGWRATDTLVVYLAASVPADCRFLVARYEHRYRRARKSAFTKNHTAAGAGDSPAIRLNSAQVATEAEARSVTTDARLNRPELGILGPIPPQARQFPPDRAAIHVFQAADEDAHVSKPVHVRPKGRPGTGS